MQIKTKGIILKQRNIGENDRIVTILSPELGVIEASARGCKSVKSSLASSVQILGYSDFCLYKGKSQYIINSAESINSFYFLRLDVVKLSLAGYFCELICYLSKTDDENANLYLKLILNSLYFLQEDKIDIPLLKSIFELRALSIGGFMPNLVCCDECAIFEKDTMYFFPLKGILICEDCLSNLKFNTENSIKILVPLSVLSALRHIIYSEFEKLFLFRLKGESLKQLNYITENYMLLHTEAKFNSLSMYHSISNTL